MLDGQLSEGGQVVVDTAGDDLTFELRQPVPA
jgi:hypothetical protein